MCKRAWSSAVNWCGSPYQHLTSMLMVIILYCMSWQVQGFTPNAFRSWGSQIFTLLWHWSIKFTEATQWNMIKLRSISCCEIMRCSCAVESVIWPSSKPLIFLELWSNITWLDMYYFWDNHKKVVKNQFWSFFMLLYVCCLTTLYENDQFEKFALSENFTRSLV